MTASLLDGIRLARLEGDPLGDVVELFVRREEAEQLVADRLADEPVWADVLSVEPLEFEFLGQLAPRIFQLAPARSTSHARSMPLR